jgi:hypothetical protein
MPPILIFTLYALCNVALSGKPFVEPEYLEMLRATGQDEEFARLMGIDVNLVRPQDGRSEEDIVFTKVSDLGDILLTPEQEEQARQGIRFDKYPGSKWTNNEIPYTISTSDFTSSQISRISSAISALNSKMKNLKLVQRNNQKDYVMVISGRGCYSYLGRTGNQQTLSLQSNGCLRTGTIQHEFIHAAGFTHEHNRPDRDNYVRILWDNIPSSWRSQYNKASSNTFGNQEIYDYYSVMHYGYNAPGTNKPAFELLDKSINSNRLGQRDGPTDRDVRKIDTLYS